MARLLLLFGLGFLVADARAIVQQILYWHRRRAARLTWPAGRPPFFLLQVGIGVALGLLLLFNMVVRGAPAEQTFGIGMMCLYYGYAVPMSTRIERGFYRDGVWTDRGFVPYGSVGGLAWREGHEPELLLAGRSGAQAVRLVVPGELYGAVRRLLRDLIADRTIRLADAGLHLGLKDERDDA
jgi:hypothetical protein